MHVPPLLHVAGVFTDLHLAIFPRLPRATEVIVA